MESEKQMRNFKYIIQNLISLIYQEKINILILFVLICIILPCYIANVDFRKDQKMRRICISRSYRIKLALEDYSKYNDGVYPNNIDELISTGYLPDGFPINPYSSSNNSRMKNIGFGELPREGNFTYIPVTCENKVISYYLLIYGNRYASGKDVNQDGKRDYVIFIHEGNTKNVKERCEDIPPLSMLLRNLK